ncbi:MAG: helicase-associated domain-containing protein [Caldilineaceae bacterium]
MDGGAPDNVGKQVLAALDEPQAANRRLAEATTAYAAGDQEGGRLIIQPNFQLLAIGPVALATLAKLDLFAERRKADLTVFEYHLSRESVYQGQQAGLHSDEIVAFLQTVSGAPLPQNLERSLHEWGAHHERIVFRSGITLLQAADAQILADLLTTEPAVGEQVARVVAPGVALVRKGAEQRLLQALLASDRLPAISDDQAASADHSVTIDKTGLITPLHAVPSLHLRGRLARFAEEHAPGQWRLTATTVRQAGGSRKKVLALLDELGKLQHGDLPAEVASLVRQWGGYYGEVGAATVTLLEFRDAHALAELLAQPELQNHLTPFPAGQRALALVAAKQLPTVKHILQTLGIAVKEGLLD